MKKKLITGFLMIFFILSINLKAMAITIECEIDKLVSDDGYQSFIQYESRTRKD